MDTYGHLFEDSDRESAEKMERLFGDLAVLILAGPPSGLQKEHPSNRQVLAEISKPVVHQRESRVS